MLKYGALLFRGFDVRTADEFREFVRGFSEKEFFNYAGGASPRSAVQENVYNSTEYPPDLALELHNELSYSRKYPRHLYFFCETAPAQGGETTLGDSRRIRQEIRPEIVELFKTKGVLYERYLRAETGFGYSWQEAFETADRQKIEDICRATGADFDWQENDCLRLRQVCPRDRRASRNGRGSLVQSSARVSRERARRGNARLVSSAAGKTAFELLFRRRFAHQHADAGACPRRSAPPKPFRTAGGRATF
jgi:hypothetical protein